MGLLEFDTFENLDFSEILNFLKKKRVFRNFRVFRKIYIFSQILRFRSCVLSSLYIAKPSYVHIFMAIGQEYR